MAQRSRPKFNPTLVNQASSLIKPTLIDKEQKVSFNFRRLQVKETKFDYSSCQVSYFNTLIDRLKCLSGMTRKEMTQPYNNKTLRCHQTDFSDRSVTEDSFGILGEDVDADAWQFGLTVNQHGRVHGYFVENVFYVVWLDPKHELCPGQKH